jgi:hypothetical protein
VLQNPAGDSCAPITVDNLAWDLVVRFQAAFASQLTKLSMIR